MPKNDENNRLKSYRFLPWPNYLCGVNFPTLSSFCIELIAVFLRGYKLPHTSSFFTSSPLTLISVNSKVNSKVLSLCVNMLKHAYAPTHLLFFTIFWCIFIVYTLINGLIHCISSIISSSFFTSNEFTLCSINSKVVLVCP